MSGPVRVAILGGGCAGMAAAWRLTRDVWHRQKFEVDLYQQGWRLGGKGATGRNARHGLRIEEHGLHVWLGWYRNAFEMTRDVYEHWTPPQGAWLRTIDDAFEPTYNSTLMTAPVAGTQTPWSLRSPPRRGKPWDARWQPPGAVDRVDWLVNDGVNGLRELARNPRAALSMGSGGLALVTTIARGLLADVVPNGSAGWDALDDLDLREWLARHDRTGHVPTSPPVTGIYNLAFAYPDGSPTFDGGAVAAGPGIRTMLKMLLAYRGAPFWKMTAGMGDTIFAPAYQVLRERGVRFRFFRRVESLGVDDHGRIDAIRLARQAITRGEYSPLLERDGLRFWPEEPLWDQLAEAPSALGHDYEAPHGPTVGEETLRLGDDYDVVVNAIPVPAHTTIASELMARSERYRRMVENHDSAAIAVAQFWWGPTVEELGWKNQRTVMSNHVGHFATWAEMSEVARAEFWPEPPGHIAYLCDVGSADGISTWEDGVEAVRARARAWFDEDLPRLLPAASESDLIHGPLDRGESAFDAQFFRLNFRPSDRYVLSLPGSIKHRMWPEESGFENLYLAGDWTRSSIDGGSVEAAAESGVRAADALIDRYF